MKKWIIAFLVLIIVVGGVFMLLNKPPIKVGFVGELSTTSSQLSVESREAFLYAVDKINQSGGILGRKVETYIYDDKNSNDQKEELHDALAKDDVHLIVGFNVSSMSETVEYLMSKGDYLIISPTITTDFMTGKDDRFIKISPMNALQADVLYDALKRNQAKRTLIVYSQPNHLFADGIVEKVKGLMKKDQLQYAVMAVESDLSVDAITQQMTNFNADSLFVVLNGNDTAQLVQKVRIMGFKGPIVTSAWAGTSDLITNSGQYGEGTYTVEIKPRDPDEETGKILEGYISERMNSTLNFSHKRAYNATMMLFDAIKLSQSTDPEKLKQTIISIGTFKGIETTYTIDRFGDALGEYTLKQIKDGEFIQVR